MQMCSRLKLLKTQYIQEVGDTLNKPIEVDYKFFIIEGIYGKSDRTKKYSQKCS